jgi:hypothetical protein
VVQLEGTLKYAVAPLSSRWLKYWYPDPHPDRARLTAAPPRSVKAPGPERLRRLTPILIVKYHRRPDVCEDAARETGLSAGAGEGRDGSLSSLKGCYAAQDG